MRIVLLGAGGHAREVVDVLTRLGVDAESIAFFVEPHSLSALDIERLGAQGRQVVSTLQGLTGRPFLATVGDPTLRRRLVSAALHAGLTASQVVSSDALVSSSATLAFGVVVFPHAVVSSNVSVGEHAHVNQGARLSHDTQVGAYATLGPGVLLTGGTKIGEDAVVGAGAIVLPGRSVGSGAIVGAGAVVVADVEPQTTVVGNPARVLPKG